MFLSAPVSLAENDYSKELQYLNDRYRDYFIHENMKKRMNVERRKGAAAQRAYRQKLRAQKEETRKAFVEYKRKQPKVRNREKQEKNMKIIKGLKP